MNTDAGCGVRGKRLPAARAAGDYHQGQLRAANRPPHLGPAAGPLVLGESTADSRTQSGPRRAPAGAEADRARQQQKAKIIRFG
jgi:hypothetical protein